MSYTPSVRLVTMTLNGEDVTLESTDGVNYSKRLTAPLLTTTNTGPLTATFNAKADNNTADTKTKPFSVKENVPPEVTVTAPGSTIHRFDPTFSFNITDIAGEVSGVGNFFNSSGINGFDITIIDPADDSRSTSWTFTDIDKETVKYPQSTRIEYRKFDHTNTHEALLTLYADYETILNESTGQLSYVITGYVCNFTVPYDAEKAENPISGNGTNGAFLIVAYDRDGNAGQGQQSFQCARSLPSISITSPNDNIITNNGQLTITGSADSAYGDISKVEYVLNGSVMRKSFTLTTNEGSPDVTFTNSTPIELVEGTNTIIIIATDSFGGESRETLTVNYSSKHPVISNIVFSSSPATSGQEYTVSCKVTME